MWRTIARFATRKEVVPNDIQGARIPAGSYQALAGKSFLRAVLGYGLGLGKTVVTLTAIEQLVHVLFDVAKVLIIAPRTVAEATWQEEARKWEHLRGLTFSTVLGTQQQRIRAIEKKADIYVINRENVVWLCEYYRYCMPFDMLVVDESSSFKSPTAKRFRALRKVLPCFSRRVILTGTPAPNTLMDLWAQMYLLDGGRALGKTITSYREKYFTPDRMNGYIVYSYKLQEGAAAAIYDAIAPEVMSLKASDYLELPERIDNIVRCDMGERAWELYRRMEKDMVLGLGGDEITAASAAVLSNKLLQMANGCVYTDDGGVLGIHDAKLCRLKEIIDVSEGKPVLVFYEYQHDLERLKSWFKDARVLGDDTGKTVYDWNAGKIPVLLAHPASCGYGLNLQAGGNIIVWFGLTWSLEQYQQANARLYRQGQEHAVVIHHLVTAGTMDERVMQALSKKEAGQDALLDAVKAEIQDVLKGENKS